MTRRMTKHSFSYRTETSLNRLTGFRWSSLGWFSDWFERGF